MPAPAFQILEFTSDNLYASLANDGVPSAEVAKKDRVAYLLGYLTEIKAKTIIIEHEYVDADYLDDFAAYYVKCFANYSRRCKRAHFFSARLTQDEFLEIVRGAAGSAAEEAFRNSYLGFVVARPLPDAIIGRTILKTYETDGGRRNYTCTREYGANLFGIDLHVRSLPFQEQDSVLAACATVSLWCSFHKTAELFATTVPTPSLITRIANQVIREARPIPSHGLSIQQICNAIRHEGLDPEVVPAIKGAPVPSLIYGHLRMGLPVILVVEVEGVGHHAITLAGYSIRQSRVMGQEVAAGEKCIPMTGLRIDEFYGHDDQIGPFSRVVVKPSASVSQRVYPVTFEGSWENKATGKRLVLYPEVVVIPVYHKIRVTFTDIQKLLTRLHGVLLSVFGQQQAQLEWDVHLTTTNSYKSAIKQSALDKGSLELLLLQQHPRFIWRIVLRLNGTELFELLADATDMARSFCIYRAIWYDTGFKATLNTILKSNSLQPMLRDALTQPFADFLMKSTEP